MTYLLWVIGAVALLVSSGAGTQGVLAATPLLLGAVIIWLGTLRDVLDAARGGRRELLAPRAMFWLVIIVLAALMVAFMVSVMSVRGSGA